MHSLLAATCSFLDQANSPPPSLRDILGAYNTRGDGDRDMLLALLNAKSAEDQVSPSHAPAPRHQTPIDPQRLASVAALQRTVLQLIDTHPPDPGSLAAPSGRSIHPPPTARPHRASPASSPHRRPASTSRQSRLRPATNSTLPPRKRTRASLSPASTSSSPIRPPAVRPDSEESPSPPSSSHDKALSSSPHSSKDSAEYSPRSRASMAIGSLLSSQRGSEGGVHGNRDPPLAQNCQPN